MALPDPAAGVRASAPIRGFSARDAHVACAARSARGARDLSTAPAPTAADAAPDDAARGAPVCGAHHGVSAVRGVSVHSALFGDITGASDAVATDGASGDAADRLGDASTNLAGGASAAPSPQGAARELSGPGAPIGRAGP